MFMKRTTDKNLKHETVSFLSFLTMIPDKRPPIMSGGIDNIPIINEDVPDANLY